jgi:hypothetical protein
MHLLHSSSVGVALVADIVALPDAVGGPLALTPIRRRSQ